MELFSSIRTDFVLPVASSLKNFRPVPFAVARKAKDSKHDEAANADQLKLLRRSGCSNSVVDAKKRGDHGRTHARVRTMIADARPRGLLHCTSVAGN